MKWRLFLCHPDMDTHRADMSRTPCCRTHQCHSPGISRLFRSYYEGKLKFKKRFPFIIPVFFNRCSCTHYANYTASRIEARDLVAVTFTEACATFA